MGLIRAVALKDFTASANALSTSGASAATGYSTAAPGSGEGLYGALHLTQVSTGRPLVVTVQSASSSGFGSITAELTFALTSEIGSTWKTLAAPSTDRPWRRASWTLSTAGGSTDGSWRGLVWIGFR